MSEVLITGGAGYIGSHVNKGLSAEGFDTLVLDNLVYGHAGFVKWGQFVLADLADMEQLRLIFRRHDIQAVLHFAAFAYVGESVIAPRKYYRNNVGNALNLLDAMMEFGVKKFVLSSTCATYGMPATVPIPETHAQVPINPYGRSKLMIENILADYDRAYDLHYVSLRYFNAAGADPEGDIGEWHVPETHLIPLVLDAACGGREAVQIFGTDYDTIDGTCIRDYIHATDLARAHILALRYLESGGTSTAFNLGNGNGFSVKDVISRAMEVTQREIRTAKAARRPGDPPVLIGDARKAGSELGWVPEYCDLDTIISTAWKWHQKMVGTKHVRHRQEVA
jgi:UDP-glucose 4-epimerase